MAQSFFKRLRKYYLSVAEVLRGEANAASIFPNPSDIGMSRERVYADFLRLHAPSKCNVFLGGNLFDEDGAESHQLDVIITTDTAPRFNLPNRDGMGKSSSPVEGTLGVASIKSRLDKVQLEDALLGIASIPPMKPLGDRLNPSAQLNDYGDWPYKIIYATDGIKGQTLFDHLVAFYQTHTDIPVTRRPHIIHVAGKYVIFRIVKGMKDRGVTGEEQELEYGTFWATSRNSDLQAIVWVLDSLQQNASAATHILFSYKNLISKVLQVS